MQRRDFLKRLDLTNHLFGDSLRSAETIRSMYHPMSNAIDIARTIDAMIGGAAPLNPLEQEFRSMRIVPDFHISFLKSLFVPEQGESRMLFADVVVSAGS